MALLYITLLGFIPYLVLVWRAPELRWSRVRSTIFTFALLLRLGMLAWHTNLSNDTARYLWDGHIQTHGFNPYVYAPDAPELASFRDANWEQLDHKDVPSVYPPLLLVVFRVIAAFAPHRWMFRLVFTLFDLLTFWLLAQLLRSRKQNPSLALIWALNPLVILEFAGSGHEMSLAIALFVTGLWMLEARLTPLGALAFAGAVLSHLLALPLVIMVFLAMRLKSLRIWLWFWLPVLLGYALFIGAGRDLWAGLVQMAGRWRFNGSLYELLARVLDPTVWRNYGEFWIAHLYTKVVCFIILGGTIVWLTRRRIAPIPAALTMAGCFLLVSSTVHPWYVTWLVALACLEFKLPWLMFSAVVIVSYLARIAQLQTGVWLDTASTRWLEYTPLYALLLVALWRKRFDRAALRQ